MSMIFAMFVTRNFLRLFLGTKLENATWLWGGAVKSEQTALLANRDAGSE